MPPSSLASDSNVDTPDGGPTLGHRLLSRNPAFRDCPGAVLDELVCAGQVWRHERGEVLVRHGDRAGYLGLVVSGLLQTSRLYKSGARQITCLMVPGDLFNLIEVVDPGLQFGEITAKAASVVLRIPALEVERLQLRESRLAMAFARHLAVRLCLVFERSAASAALPLKARVAAILNLLVQLYGLPRENGVVLDIKLSQEDLADLVGMSRQRLSFALKQLETEGLIQLGYTSLMISDPARLAALAEAPAKD